MAKALYFSHDADARGDKKMLAMRYDYKLKGYGMFWIIVETMRTADNYELEYSDCTCKALAKQMDSTSTIVKKFIDDCINTYKLFKLRNGVFWSESFKARMAKMDEVREKRSEAGKKRWGKPYNANAKQMLSKCLTTKPNQTKPNQKKKELNDKSFTPSKKKPEPNPLHQKFRAKWFEFYREYSPLENPLVNWTGKQGKELNRDILPHVGTTVKTFEELVGALERYFQDKDCKLTKQNGWTLGGFNCWLRSGIAGG